MVAVAGQQLARLQQPLQRAKLLLPVHLQRSRAEREAHALRAQLHAAEHAHDLRPLKTSGL